MLKKTVECLKPYENLGVQNQVLSHLVRLGCMFDSFFSKSQLATDVIMTPH